MPRKFRFRCKFKCQKCGKVISKMGYDGPIMVEIFSEELWKKDSRTIVEEVVERFRKLEAEVTL